MPLDVFDAVPLALLALLDREKNPLCRFLRPVKVWVDIVDVDEHAVDDVRDLGPALSLLAFLAVMLRPAIVGRGGGEHDHAVAGLHLAVAQPAVLAQHPGAFAKSERPGEPVHRRRSILVRDHRDHCGVLVHHAASPGWYSPNTARNTAQHSPIVT